MSHDSAFASCSYCHTSWSSRQAFLDASAFDVVGYTADHENPVAGKIHFVHTDEGCYAPFTLPVALFLTLLEPTVVAASMHGAPTCPGRCDDPFCVDPCYNQCSMAAARRLVFKLAEIAQVSGLIPV